VGETNYGGDMVRAVIQGVNPNAPFKKVTATRGKHIRAEPISLLYEQGRIHHVGYFPELEDQACAMTTSGYMGLRSPDRLDSCNMGIY
jgi:phage terminase large subunit-like protein